MKMEQNYLNIKFVSQLLNQLNEAFRLEEDVLRDVTVNKWGVHDDYIFCEHLQKYFTELLPHERKALMSIARTVICASAEAYYELIEDNYLGYEMQDNEALSLNEFIDRLQTEGAEY
ncbi:hypothetical protein [Thalassotalea litorea]|uniref:hypothetical protein n=1 Tax=Thalassotalea litorea TaxID=2020715 RepID=UPI003734F5A3